jgi:outer membrane protein assembly factor BamA
MRITFRIIVIPLIFISELLSGGQKEFFHIDSAGTSGYFIVKSIEISGNKVTREKIVLRELTFSLNDTLDAGNLQYLLTRSRDNLLKTSLFNYVYFDTVTNGDKLLQVFIKLEERWYTWPEFYFNHADRNLSAWWQSRDFSRINYGLGLSQYNFRGRKEKISVRGITGFTTQFALIYDNVYLDRQQRHSMNIAAFYENQNKLVYITHDNVPQVFSDDHVIYRKYQVILKYTYRHKLYNIHQFTAAYSDFMISDTVVYLNPEFLGSGKIRSDFFTFIYNFESDHTNLKYYPLLGSIFKCRLSYSGMLHSGFDKIELRSGYFKFYRILPRVYGDAGVKFQLGHKSRIPYILNAGLGYDSFLRGYENYVIDGYNYILVKSSVKFELLPFKVIKLNFLPVSQFNKIHVSAYLNLFFDAGYVHDYYTFSQIYGNNLVDKPLYSGGVGFDIVTYYDKMLRIDLASNNIGDFGVFVSFEQKL